MGSDFLKNIQIRQLLRIFHTFIIGFNDPLIVEEHPLVSDLDMCHITAGMYGRSLVRDEGLQLVDRWYRL